MSFAKSISKPRVKPDLVRRVLTLGGVALLALLPLSSAQAADPLPAPKGPVILLVTGNLGVTNTPEGAAFDRDMLADLGLSEVRTSTPWTDGVQVFEGVLARTVVERIQAKGELVKAAALNDYTVELPLADFLDNDVLLAMTMNGEAMQVSDKGPIWIIYPRDDVPAFQNRQLNDRWVWQLKSLDVQ